MLAPGGESVTVSAIGVMALDPGNAAPVAVLEADTASGDAGLTVNFDGSGSWNTVTVRGEGNGGGNNSFAIVRQARGLLPQPERGQPQGLRCTVLQE